MFFHIQNEEYTHLSCLLLPAHYCYDRYFLSRQYYERHTFYRKHFWRFTTFRTKNMHTYLVCCCQRTIATIDISFRHEFIVKHFWCFSTFRTKNIHMYVVCCCQSTLATIDIPIRASITNHTRFIENISGVFHI